MTKIEEVFKDILGIIWGEEKEEKKPTIKMGKIPYDGMMKEKPKRARGKKGKFLADDKSTKDVNEAWVGGKSPKKKITKRRKK